MESVTKSKKGEELITIPLRRCQIYLEIFM